jgi:hypothetical protein
MYVDAIFVIGKSFFHKAERFPKFYYEGPWRISNARLTRLIDSLRHKAALSLESV